MSDNKTLTGHCLCGGCAFTLIGPHNWVGHCHCESCRRASSSPMTTWIGQENGTWAISGYKLTEFTSSPSTTRGFCPACGSQLFYKSERFPNEVHFYAALLDDPNAVTPTSQFHADEALHWVHDALQLPKR